MASIRRSSPLASASFSAGSLALPASIRKNSSFVRLANLVGFGKWAGNAPSGGGDAGEDEDEDEEDDEGEGSSGSGSGSDETPTEQIEGGRSGGGVEGRLWDAKAALTANQPLLAIEHYTAAAMPPYRSPEACLALGKILLDEAKATTPSASPVSRKGKEKALPPSTTLPLSKSGNRRDVEAMGIAAGWFVLGIAWIVQSQSQAGGRSDPETLLDNLEDDEDEPLILTRKPHHSTHRPRHHAEHRDRQLDLLVELLQPLLELYRARLIRADDPVALPPIASSQLPDVIKSQGHAGKGRNAWHLGNTVAEKLLRLDVFRGEETHGGEGATHRTRASILTNFILGLTTPVLQAVGHWKTVVDVAAHDSTLPAELVREASEHLDKLTSDPFKGPVTPNSKSGRPNFPRHLTPPVTSHRSNRAVSAPQPVWRPTHSRQVSISSINTFSSTQSGAPSRLVSFTIRPSPSQASLSVLSDDGSLATATPQSVRSSGSALETLRRIQAEMYYYDEDEHDHYDHTSESTAPSNPTSPQFFAQDPSTSSLATSTHPSPAASEARLQEERAKTVAAKGRLDVPTIRHIASTPVLPTLDLGDPPNVSTASTPRRKLPFEPTKDQRINGVDPALAAAELSSALTKHVVCGVCNAKGVNFPNCRKCGLTFCSRSCRVDADKGGDGKRHVCGAWQTRKLLSPPPVSPTGKILREAGRSASIAAR